MAFLILTAERELEISRQDYIAPSDDKTWSEPARQPVRTDIKDFFEWLRPKQVCTCS
jgi:hypothetical protein